MNVFLQGLSEAYPNDYILLPCDGATWHTSNALKVPANIELFKLPPATPEMNPIEQIWKELRTKGFRNEIFKTLDKVIDRLCDTICDLSHQTVKTITARKWIAGMFLLGIGITMMKQWRRRLCRIAGNGKRNPYWLV
jgi:putative transposase